MPSPDVLPFLAQGLAALAPRLGPPAGGRVDLLKSPLCVSEPRRLVLEQLARHSHRRSADKRALLRFADEQKLDLTTPPRRPGSSAPAR